MLLAIGMITTSVYPWVLITGEVLIILLAVVSLTLHSRRTSSDVIKTASVLALIGAILQIIYILCVPDLT
jgi:predicted membrane protein